MYGNSNEPSPRYFPTDSSVRKRNRSDFGAGHPRDQALSPRFDEFNRDGRRFHEPPLSSKRGRPSWEDRDEYEFERTRYDAPPMAPIARERDRYDWGPSYNDDYRGPSHPPFPPESDYRRERLRPDFDRDIRDRDRDRDRPAPYGESSNYSGDYYSRRTSWHDDSPPMNINYPMRGRSHSPIRSRSPSPIMHGRYPPSRDRMNHGNYYTGDGISPRLSLSLEPPGRFLPRRSRSRSRSPVSMREYSPRGLGPPLLGPRGGSGYAGLDYEDRHSSRDSLGPPSLDYRRSISIGERERGYARSPPPLLYPLMGGKDIGYRRNSNSPYNDRDALDNISQGAGISRISSFGSIRGDNSISSNRSPSPPLSHLHAHAHAGAPPAAASFSQRRDFYMRAGRGAGRGFGRFGGMLGGGRGGRGIAGGYHGPGGGPGPGGAGTGGQFGKKGQKFYSGGGAGGYGGGMGESVGVMTAVVGDKGRYRKGGQKQFAAAAAVADNANVNGKARNSVEGSSGGSYDSRSSSSAGAGSVGGKAQQVAGVAVAGVGVAVVGAASKESDDMDMDVDMDLETDEAQVKKAPEITDREVKKCMETRGVLMDYHIILALSKLGITSEKKISLVEYQRLDGYTESKPSSSSLGDISSSVLTSPLAPTLGQPKSSSSAAAHKTGGVNMNANVNVNASGSVGQGQGQAMKIAPGMLTAPMLPISTMIVNDLIGQQSRLAANASLNKPSSAVSLSSSSSSTSRPSPQPLLQRSLSSHTTPAPTAPGLPPPPPHNPPPPSQSTGTSSSSNKQPPFPPYPPPGSTNSLPIVTPISQLSSYPGMLSQHSSSSSFHSSSSSSAIHGHGHGMQPPPPLSPYIQQQSSSSSFISQQLTPGGEPGVGYMGYGSTLEHTTSELSGGARRGPRGPPPRHAGGGAQVNDTTTPASNTSNPQLKTPR